MNGENQRAYETVMQYIKSEIASGVLRRGDRLRPEREIAVRLGVSRTAVREALKNLEMLGVVSSVQGAGNFISADMEKSFSESVSLMFLLQQTDGAELNAIRSPLETAAAVLALKNITRAQITALERLAAEMAAAPDEAQRARCDRQFHFTIAQASQNRLLISILGVLSDVYDRFIRNIRKEILSDETNCARLQTIHEDMVRSLKNRDEASLRRAVEAHSAIIGKYL